MLTRGTGENVSLQGGTSRSRGSRPAPSIARFPMASRTAAPFYCVEKASILTELSSVELLESHSSTSVTTSMISTSGMSSPDTSATRWRSWAASVSIVSVAARSISGGLVTCSFLTRSGWNDFRQSGQALGERFRRQLWHAG